MTNAHFINIYTLMRERLNKAAKAYYDEDTPIMTDANYDELLIKVKEMENDYPFLKDKKYPEVYKGVAKKEMKKIRRQTPMLSIETKVDTSITPLVEFMEKTSNKLKIENIEYCAELKYDGLAVELIYINKKLESASTRGDGYVGEDVTDKCLDIFSIPTRLKNCEHDYVVVRGEVIITHFNFEEINNTQKLIGRKTYSNPRNAAAGILRSLNDTIKPHILDFIPYSLFVSRELVSPNETQFENLDMLMDYGFSLLYSVPYIKATTLEDLRKFYDYDNLQYIPIDIDGIVYKVNNISYQNELGFTKDTPRWAYAHKFPPKEVTSYIRDIIIQVGRTGKITPVAKIDPVLIGGVVVSSATLYNQNEIYSKNIAIGDEVIVRRAGEVVPEITKSITEHTGDKCYNIYSCLNGKCPSCSSPLIKSEEADYYCSNSTTCPAQLKQALINWADKLAVNIEGLGPNIIGLLVDKNIVSSIPDLYQLTRQQWLSVLPNQFKTVDKLINEINVKSKIPLDRFILGLGIRYIGYVSSKALAKRAVVYDNLHFVINKQINEIENFGDKSIESITSFFSNPKNIDMLNQLFKFVEITPFDREIIVSKKLNGFEFILTGSFEIGRKQIENIIIKNGGVISSSVKQTTNYIIVGDDPGSKLNKAILLNIKQISYPELLTMLEGKNND